MPNQTITDMHPAELASIVESVFAAMMDLHPVECPTPWLPNNSRLSAAVHLAGDWCGAVLLECDRRQACHFAARFLAMGAPPGDPPATVDDVVRDVLGELANMIGGNLKCVLTRGTRLSMPCVVDGDYTLRVCGATSQDRLGFSCDEGVFWVTVLTIRN
jgi:chemotaxis protein CheX